MKKKILDKYFLLNWRKFWITVGSFFLSIILHNLTYAILSFEDVFFFIIAMFIIPAYFLVAFIYTVIYRMKKK